MREKLFDFIKYNNAFTIIFVILFFGAGLTFAASPAVRDSVYASEETVIAVDNSLIMSTDLASFNFNLRINSITDDTKNYYATYSYQTLVIENGIWQNKEITKILTVSKEALAGKDLGLYVARELGENINYELSYLKKVQKLEREKGESQKVVAVEYSGLIGKLLDPKEMVIDGYSPVIPEIIPAIPATVELNPKEVIVSTPYIKPTSPTPEVAPTPESTSPTPPVQEPTPEPTSTPPQTEPVQEPIPIATSTPSQEEPTPTTTPTPEEMIDENLVKEVVDQLLQADPTPTPTPTPETSIPTPEELSGTSTP